jgi:hypothetical protein
MLGEEVIILPIHHSFPAFAKRSQVFIYQHHQNRKLIMSTFISHIATISSNVAGIGLLVAGVVALVLGWIIHPYTVGGLTRWVESPIQQFFARVGTAIGVALFTVIGGPKIFPQWFSDSPPSVAPIHSSAESCGRRRERRMKRAV